MLSSQLEMAKHNPIPLEEVVIGNKDKVTVQRGLTNGSGIQANNPERIIWFAENTPVTSVVSKSITADGTEGYREPVFAAQPNKGFNAMGLPNPGVEEYVSEMEPVYSRLKELGKTLVTSVAGGSVEEFVDLAKLVAHLSDIIELNLSCPHAISKGSFFGTSTELTDEVVSEVVKVVNNPIMPKLTPAAEDIGEIAKAAEDAGASAISAINTVPAAPYFLKSKKEPLVSNFNCGMSGKEVLPVGLKCVSKIAKATDLPLSVMGGIAGPDGIYKYWDASQEKAFLFGAVGTQVVYGITSKTLSERLRKIKHALHSATSFQDYNMGGERPSKFYLENREMFGEDVGVLRFRSSSYHGHYVGKYISVRVLKNGEKPFSVASHNPLQLVVRRAGPLSDALLNLKKDDVIYGSSSHGTSFDLDITPKNKIVISGGTGVAAVYELIEHFGKTTFFYGTRTKAATPLLEEIQEKAEEVIITTDDGTLGEKGLITEALEAYLISRRLPQDTGIYMCGPTPMMRKAVEILDKHKLLNKTQGAVENYMKCMSGSVCGSCVTPGGLLACVDGPVFRGEDLKITLQYSRGADGRKIDEN